MPSSLSRRQARFTVLSPTLRALSLLSATSLLACLGFASPAAAAPASLLVPQSTAFAVLGHSCGGIQEQAFATSFDAVTGRPAGDVYLQTRCGGSGRGGGYKVTTYSAWVSATWDFSAALVSSARLAAAPTGLSPTFSATDAHGDVVYNALSAINVTPANCTVQNTSYCTYRAYLTVPAPAAATAVTAVQSGDSLQVSWTPDPATAAVITSSTVTATPVGSTAPVLTATVSGNGTSAVVPSVQPQTTYQVTVINSDLGGASPGSSPVTVSTAASAVAPSAPTGVAAHWTAPQQPGDTLAASWSAAVPGDSPVDQYELMVWVNDPGNPVPGPFTETVSGSTLSGAIAVDDTLDWTVQVRAHNAAGWGPWSTPIVLPAA